jgi:hypothetical protein
MSKFAAALKAKTGTPVKTVSKPESQAAEAVRARAREGTKHIRGVFHSCCIQAASILSGCGGHNRAGFTG